MDVSVTNPVAEFSAPPGRGGAALARDFVRRTLADWGYRGDHDDAVLVVSELVTNTLRHASGVPLLRLVGAARGLRIEVADSSPVLPRSRPPGSSGGWGVPLVQRLTACWGTEPRSGGKVVWCEMPATAS
ncbi:ATP-binding protein [Saccharothrix sp. BKS2]|uniref:ATP-binding protein n=1 Tax=Saccharothrix sp. BKS2 TaxID=3064400 RepID=UPI0039EA9479